MNVKQACAGAVRAPRSPEREMTDAAKSAVATVHSDGEERLVTARLAVLEAAARIDPDPAQVVHWYRFTPIRELGELTAEAFIGSDRASDDLAFLHRAGNAC